jgi:hypothetical protein
VAGHGQDPRHERREVLIPVHQEVEELVQAGEDRKDGEADVNADFHGREND